MIWYKSKLGDLGRVVTGKTPSRARMDYFGNDHPFVMPSDFGFMNYYCRDVAEGVSEAGFEKHKNQTVPRDATLCVCIGNTIGKCAIASEPSLTNQQINSVIAGPNSNPKFIYYLLCNMREQIRSVGLGGGAAQPIINKSKFSALEVRVPDLPTQQAIAEILSAYDDLIDNNRQRIMLLEEAAWLLYREWFVHFRFPGHEHVKIIEGVPAGWERRTLGSALNLQRGFDLPISRRVAGGIPVYGSTGIVGEHNMAKVDSPTLITGRSGSLGKVCFVDDPCWPLNTSLWVTDFKAVSIYFAYFMLSEMDLAKFSGGVSVPTLDRKVAHAANVLIPTRNTAVRFDEHVEIMFKQKKLLNQQIQKLVRARELLLPRLLNGQLAV